MLIRKLTVDDLEAVWMLRLRALKDNPEAFGSTYEEAFTRGKAWMLQSLGFEVYGTEPKALKFGEQYWDEHLMVLHLHSEA